jgi:hypothetical protein
MFKINLHIVENLVAWLKKPVALWKEGRTYFMCACEMMDVLHCNSYKKLTIMKMELVQQRGLKNKRKRGWVIKAHVLHSFSPSFVFHIILHGLKWSYRVVCLQLHIPVIHSHVHTYLYTNTLCVCVYFEIWLHLKQVFDPANWNWMKKSQNMLHKMVLVHHFCIVWQAGKRHNKA